MEDVIKKNNDAVNKWNFYATLAAKDMSEEHVKEVKQQMILQPIRESKAAGNGPELYHEIVVLATKTLNRLVKEWFGLRSEDRPRAKDELFRKMIKHCRKIVQSKAEKNWER